MPEKVQYIPMYRCQQFPLVDRRAALELLRQRVAAAETAANKNGAACDRLNARVLTG